MFSLLYDLYLQRKNVIVAVRYILINVKFWFTSYFAFGTQYNVHQGILCLFLSHYNSGQNDNSGPEVSTRSFVSSNKK